MDISQVGISARRRHVTAVIAIDTSYSMSSRQGGRTRLQAASQGASKVVESLQEDDHVAVLAFGSEIENVSHGIVELNPSNKASLQRKLRFLEPSGMTALYDTIIMGCNMVLEMSSLAEKVGSQVAADLGTFWFVVLTDGDDTSSKSSQSDAEQILRIIGSVLGTKAMKLVFIGVSLGDSERRKLMSIVEAGGEMTTFREANNVEGIQTIFDEIAVQIQVTQVRIRPANPLEQLAQALKESIQDSIEEGGDSSSSWPGPIQKGSHVRCVGQSRGAGSVSIGDVGVVKSRDADGDYRVNFPSQDNWAGRPSDVVLDSSAEKVCPGAIVTVKSSVTSPKYTWGSFKRGMQGLVHKVDYDGDVYVQFGFDFGGKASDNLWKSQLSELEAVDISSSTQGPWPGHLQPGQAVRVPLRLESPSTGWGTLKHGEVGYVRSYNSVSSDSSLLYLCDFPSVDGWKGRAQDLEVEAIANHIRPGKQVRVRDGVVPRGGWAGVSPNSTGKVLSISYDGNRVVVCFPEHPSWNGTLSELKTLDGPKTERVIHSSPSGVKDCAGRHGLLPFLTTHAGMSCDCCGRSDLTSGTRMFGCRQCDTDACAKCYEETARKFGINTAVVLRGLNSQTGAPLNGKMAHVVSYSGDDQYRVQLLGHEKKIIAVKECNVSMPTQKHSNGTEVILQNMLSQTELNGRQGKVIGFDSKKGHYTVRCESDGTVDGMRKQLTVTVPPTMLKVEPRKIHYRPSDHERTDSQPARGIDAALGDAFNTEGSSNKVDFIGENMSVREMKMYLRSKGVSTVGAAEKRDLRKLVWETQVSELSAAELESFMQKQGIRYDIAWSMKVKRATAEAGYKDEHTPEAPNSSSAASQYAFVGEGMSIGEMKSYLTSKCVSTAGILERNDIQKLVWETQVNELGAADLEAFMQHHGIHYDQSWGVKLKRTTAEEAYPKGKGSSESFLGGQQGEVPIAVAVPLSATDEHPTPSAPPLPVDIHPVVSSAVSFKKGDIVKMVGLKKECMNGLIGVIETGKVTGGRLEVQILDDSGKTVFVKTQNIEPIEDLLD